jgi:hypothetical protein
MSKEILLSQGKIATIDDEDYLWVNQWKWYFDGRYAVRKIHFRDGDGNRECIKIYLHRAIIQPIPEYVVDHIDRDTLNNSRKNLRVVTYSQNGMNSGSKRGRNYKGAYFCNTKKKWAAKITLNRKPIWLGHFKSKKEAIKAYNNASIEFHKEFRLNAKP